MRSRLPALAIVVVPVFVDASGGEGAPCEGAEPHPSALSTQTGMVVILGGDFGLDGMVALAYL